MKFGRIPAADAAGAILAHSVRQQGLSLKKGRILDAGDVGRLLAAGIDEVVAARLEPGEYGEDETAGHVTAALIGAHLESSAAFTGRCNVYAASAGLLVYDPGRLDALNLIDEAITIAALPPFTVVTERQLLATVKIIPYGVEAGIVENLVEAARSDTRLLRVAPFVPYRVGLVQTGANERIHDKTRRVLDQRLARLGSTIVSEKRCDHHEDAVARAVTSVRDEGGEMILIAGASATADRRDVVPVGVESAGGRIIHMGMPVEPGNLLMLGAMNNGHPVICLPGCARSPALNGVDWVLERLCARLEVGPREVMRMGAGGLIKHAPDRINRKAARAAEPDAAPPRRAVVGAVVLAAGAGAAASPLLETLGGEPLIRRVVRTLAESQSDPVVVVLGGDAARVRAALEGCAVETVEIPDYTTGISASLRHGLDALPEDIDGALICLGNMPWVRTIDVDRLIAAFEPDEGRLICVATHRGEQGHPVLWARRFFDELRQIRGDAGARDVLGRHGEFVCEVESNHDGVIRNAHGPEDLDRAAGDR